MSLSKNEIIVVLFGALFMVLFGQFLFLAADTPSQGIADNLIPMYWYQVGMLFVLLIAMLWSNRESSGVDLHIP